MENTNQSEKVNKISSSIYVGDLDKNITETILFEVFRKVGPISSIRLCRDKITKRSLGYAYVNYQNPEDADRAIDTLNYTHITGGADPIRIMFAQSDPTIRKSGKGNIFIKNLHPNITSSDLFDNFQQYGPILSCKVKTENGNSKGFGFVHFEKESSAIEAIKNINGLELEGKIVEVCEFVPNFKRTPGVLVYTNVYVKNIHSSVTEKQVEELFAKFGEITSLVVMKGDNIDTKFGFVNFKNTEDAQKAINSLHDSLFNGLKLYVSKAKKKSERLNELKNLFELKKLKYQNSNLYIKNLDDLVDDEKLCSVFSVYGKIISAKVMRDENGFSKCFGFVCFESSEDANNAMRDQNGKMIISKKPLYVSHAQKKDIRRAKMQSIFLQKQMNLLYPRNNFNQNPQNNVQHNRRKNQHNPMTNENKNVANNNNVNDPRVLNFELLIQKLHNSKEENKKTLIGDYLYCKIDEFFRFNPTDISDAGKVTGMLIESLDDQELLNLAEDSNELVEKIKEALLVIQENQEIGRASCRERV